MLPHSYRDLSSYPIWGWPLLGSNLNICHILDIASPLAIFRCLCEVCNFFQKLPLSPNSRISPKSPLFKGPLFASRRGLQRIFTTYYNRKSDLKIKRFAYFRLRSFKTSDIISSNLYQPNPFLISYRWETARIKLHHFLLRYINSASQGDTVR